MNTKVRSKLNTILSVFLLLIAFSPVANANKTRPAKANQNYLMVQSAQTADIKQNQNSNTYTVTLENVSPYVSYFSERPDRKAGTMHIDEFLKLWTHQGKDSFSANPPNADLHATQIMSSSEAINFPIELTNPVYNHESKTLSYTATPLKGSKLIPDLAKVQHVLLFIDQVCLSCWK